MTLALLLTAVTGAWAQTAFGVKEITADMLPASWSTDESAVTADDLAKLGFMEVTEDAAKTWTGAPQKGNVRLIYTVCKSVNWVDGEGEYATDSYTRKIFYSCLNGQRIFITTELTEWPLTPDADKKVWTLAKMPANNIELQVEYYAESNIFLGKEALANKANISVLNGSTAVTFDDAGKSANTITEGNTVTVTYTGSKKIIGVKAEKKAAAKTLAEATSEDIGKIAGKDGKIYATKADAEAVATGNAVAMIAYVGTASDCAHGLAIALADESAMNWGNAGTACSGKAAVTGGTWRLPSDKDWQYMFIGCGSSGSYSTPTFAMEKSYSGLASKLTTAQGAALQSEFYWSSTKDEPNGAWGVVFEGSNATFYMEDKTVDHKVRACLAF